MIRANLLPRPKETLRVFGFVLDRGLLRECLLGATVVVAAAASAFGLETLALVRFQREANELTAAVVAHAPVRAESQRLAFEVARYDEFAREMEIARRSGPNVANKLVRIGNAVPARVWLDTLTPTEDHLELTGTSASIDAIGGALVTLGAALPDTAATLVSLERREDDGDLHFTALLGGAVPSAAPGAAR